MTTTKEAGRARDDETGPALPPQPARSRVRQAISLLLKVAVSAGLIALVASKVDIAAVSGRIAVVDRAWASVALVLFLAQLVISALRWWEIAKRLGVPLTRSAAVRLGFIGHAFSQALPTAIGGDAVRAWLAARESGVFGRAISSVLCDRVVALVVLLLIASAGQALLSGPYESVAPLAALKLVIWAITAVAVVGTLIGADVVLPLSRFKGGAALRRLLLDIRTVVGKPWIQAVEVLALSIAVQLCLILAVYCIGRGLALPLDLTVCLLMIPPILVATVLPISVGGWGVREGAMVVGLGLVGVPAEGALALSILFGLGNLVLAIPGGVLWLFARGSQPRRHA